MQNVTEAKGEAEMTDAPDAARGVAGRLAEAFERDRGLAERQADRQPPANDELRQSRVRQFGRRLGTQ